MPRTSIGYDSNCADRQCSDANTAEAHARYKLNHWARRAEHRQQMEVIVRMEIDLNARVYALFDLTAAEIKIIEESTKYQYGEV